MHRSLTFKAHRLRTWITYCRPELIPPRLLTSPRPRDVISLLSLIGRSRRPDGAACGSERGSGTTNMSLARRAWTANVRRKQHVSVKLASVSRRLDRRCTRCCTACTSTWCRRTSTSYWSWGSTTRERRWGGRASAAVPLCLVEVRFERVNWRCTPAWFLDLSGSGKDEIHEELQGHESQQDHDDRGPEYRQDRHRRRFLQLLGSRRPGGASVFVG